MGQVGGGRRVSGVLLVLAMLLAVATACSGGTDGDGDGDGDGAEGGGAAATADVGDADSAGAEAETPATATTLPAEPETPSDATPPGQPASGPGGSDYAHGDWRVSEGGSGADAWYAFEPVDPRPASAPVVVLMHGYYEYSGYDQGHGFIRHLVRRGNVVVYPRYQTDIAEPCPGPVDIEPCLQSATRGIEGALDHLEAGAGRVRPDLDRVIYFGFSFGGIITSNLANRYAELGLPTPRAIFLDDPHDGGVAGQGEPALDDSLDGIPESVLFVCHSGAEGVIAEPGKGGSSCNAVFPKLDHVPADNKSLVLVGPDRHGTPPLSSTHGVCTARPDEADAYDWNFCWRTADALRSAVEDGTDSEYALGDTPEQRSLGAWSDGVAVLPLTVRDEAPIAP